MDRFDQETNNGSGNPEQDGYKLVIYWDKVSLMVLMHLAAIYGIVLIIADSQYKTFLFGIIVVYLTGFGIGPGTHRLWAHRGYKATLPLQVILVILQTMALQTSVINWCRDHRVHHKFPDTNADPHNSLRGFFFSHVGWLLCKRHPDVKEKGKTVDISDLENDPLLQFQKKYYIPLAFFIWGVLPAAIPCCFWGEKLTSSIFICVFYRYIYTQNVVLLINSAAHKWGTKPYDKTTLPVECIFRHLMVGEGFHNYHHAFPWDYSASELGAFDAYIPGTVFIDIFAKIGWAYDLRKPSKQVVDNKVARSGDTTINRKTSRFMEIGVGFLSSMSIHLFLLALKIACN